MRIIGVIPAYNEASRVAETLRRCLQFVDQIVLVDDGSTDQTSSVASMDLVTVLRHRINRGQGAALRTGTQAALNLGADIIVHLDADGQHDPSELPRLIQLIKDNQADVVLGSRFMDIQPSGMPFFRFLLLKAGRQFNTFALGIPHTLTDPQSGLRVMTSAAARKLQFTQDGMAHASELLRLITRSNLRWLEAPIHVKYTVDSLNKGQKPWNAFSIAWQLFISVFTG